MIIQKSKKCKKNGLKMKIHDFIFFFRHISPHYRRDGGINKREQQAKADLLNHTTSDSDLSNDYQIVNKRTPPKVNAIQS